MSIAAVQTALIAHLKTMTGLPPLQEENTRYAPTTNVNYCRATLLPAQPQQISVGVTGKDLLNGLLQVDLFVPQDTGIAAANALADDVVEHFPRGLLLSSSGVITHCQRAWRQTGGRFGNHYQVPVVIQWASIV